MKRFSYRGLVFGIILAATVSASAEKGASQIIEKGRTVTFNYTLTVDGKVVDSSQGHPPLQYKHGDGKIIPGLSRQLEGLHVGDEKDIVVAPDEAYGKSDSRAFQEVPKTNLPKNMDLKIGTHLQAKNQNGSILVVTVAEVKKDTVVLNFNPPLADKELHFHVKILGVQ